MTSPIPNIQSPASIQFQEPEHFILDNGIEVFGFNGAGNNIVKVSLLFDAGRWAEKIPLSAAFCSALLKSGTDKETAYVIEEKIDFLGSTIKASSGYNSFSISLYCLTRHLESCLVILVDLLNNTTFPKSEITHSKTKRLSALKVNLIQNDYVGDMAFKELLFGSNHPYGYTTTKENINTVKREHILHYFKEKLHPGNCCISIAGKFAKTDIDLLNRYIGNSKTWLKLPDLDSPKWTIETSIDKVKNLSIANSVQASINIGNLTIGRDHPDSFKMSFLNMIYGGYFGSRLMTNVREEKGLTYGIYSHIQQYKYAAVFTINTDTAIENIEPCLKEIYFEMARLKEETISDGELLKARNYYLGRMLDQADGPFKSESTFMGLRNHGLSLSYLKKMETAIKTIDAMTLLETAQKYLIAEDMFEVVVK